MNRSIDSRSDLYAIGVTLYRMLTGALPFTAANPMEWVHSHIARRAIPPAERRSDVPDAVSAIIMLVEATRLTIEHGISPEACYPLTAIFGVLASSSTDAELGFRLSQFGAALADRHPQLGLSGRALLVFGLHVTPWIRPIRSGRPFIQRALAICLTTGELAFAAYSHRGLISVDLFCGDSLMPGAANDQQRRQITSFRSSS